MDSGVLEIAIIDLFYYTTYSIYKKAAIKEKLFIIQKTTKKLIINE